MDYTMRERSSKTSFSIGFAIPGVAEFGFNYNDNKYTKSVQKTRRVSGKVTSHSYPMLYWPLFAVHKLPAAFSKPQTSSFVRAKAELELAQYMLKSEDLMLHPEFLQRLRSLPQAYVYGEYRQIYRDYGTHYITEAALGGDYEYTIILNKEILEKSGGSYTMIVYVQNQFQFLIKRATGTLIQESLWDCPLFSRLFFGGLQELCAGGSESWSEHKRCLCVGGSWRWILWWPVEWDGRWDSLFDSLVFFKVKGAWSLTEVIASVSRGHSTAQHGGGLCCYCQGWKQRIHFCFGV